MSQNYAQPEPVSLDLGKLGRIVIAASAIVLALGLGRQFVVAQIGTGTVLQDLRHFAFDAELALPAWYSSLLMVGCAALLYLIARLAERTRRDPANTRKWLLLAVVFMAMAVDESVSFHEALIDPLRAHFGTTGILHFAWVIPGAIAVVLLGLYFLPFVLSLPVRTGLLFVLSGSLYVGGALGMELVGGALAAEHGMDAGIYLTAATVEESLEIVGLSVFFCALIDHVSRHWPVSRAIVFTDAASAGRQPARKAGLSRRARLHALRDTLIGKNA